MAMINYFVEKLPETDEVFFPMTTMVDDGSIYHDLISVETISDDESNEKEIQIFTRVGRFRLFSLNRSKFFHLHLASSS